MAEFRAPGSDGARAGGRDACAFPRGDIAAHVLGAIDGAEQARVAAHLSCCPGCRAAYDELVPLRYWLARLSWQDVVMLERCRSGGGRQRELCTPGTR